MKVHHLLYFCFFSALTDGNSGLVNVKTHTEGESVMAECHFSLSGSRKFFCKDKCTEEDILVETKDDAAQRGRYSIKYKEGSFPVSSTVVYVSITQLTKSDSGWYKCGLERPYMPDSYSEFELRVTDASTMFPESMKSDQQQTEETVAAAVHRLKVSYPAYGLPLAICVTVLFVAVGLILYKWKIRMDTDVCCL
ncbi:uncharacterized protein LOC113167771 isoform X2 [Anabas testudineus]|uniref:uncharacterized protein LOC113167771 isoform X2 n=1 Tax=Anabas testudineus TaxID=64144 RepID=UPI000E4612AD|nr:uncharacterized protein LOC113167771 isoform X2 [Anabas testudineus]